MACKLVYIPHHRLFYRAFVNKFDLRAFYCNKNDKSLEKSNESAEVTKESLQWRSSLDNSGGQWYSKLKVFATEKNNVDMVKFLQSPIDFRPKTIKKWFNKKKKETEIYLQQQIPKRNEILGNDLAAAHFIIYRGGAIKFRGEHDWIRHNENLHHQLPNVYVPHKKVEAIDCRGVNLHYEGLANFRGIEHLEWLSVNNCSEMDDWCMDRISGMFKDSLFYLDIRNCPKITDRGIGALYRSTKLKTLLVDDYTRTKTLELTCLMLQELLPELDIRSHD